MKALDFARYIIYRCYDIEKPISNLQLQQILYFVQVSFLQEKGHLAFAESIEAWQFGPVVPAVYYDFSGYGGLKIPVSEGKYIDFSGQDLVDQICAEAASLEAWELLEMSHEKGGPWHRVYNNGKGNRDIISPAVMKAHGTRK
ncbi:Panacea domain-containing protein [Peptococcus simiae]|uniref:Panacea domain-containing protein n=1 Tax=Peptococcus simiae TaxID=1643805 RepID=A0ABW9H0F4_9FIRM